MTTIQGTQNCGICHQPKEPFRYNSQRFGVTIMVALLCPRCDLLRAPVPS